MNKAQGLRRYFYEYVFYKAVERGRDQAAEIIPISQARRARARVDELLGENGTAVADPRLGVTALLTAVDQALSEQVRDYEPQFGDHTPADPRYQELQQDFVNQTGVGATNPNPKTSRLPISPYDPQWAERSTIKRGGTALAYLSDETIQLAGDGAVENLSHPRHGGMMLWRIDESGQRTEAGRAMTHDDASGLTRLMGLMSQKEYEQVREWVIDGGRDPVTGKVDRSRFMSAAALDRSVAVLEELRSQGVAYEISQDRRPGQIKAKLSGTGLEIRLTESRVNEDYAGARIYDNGMAIRYSTNHRVEQGRTAGYAPTPAEAVDLLHFAQGRSLQRQDIDAPVGAVGSTHPEMSRGRVSVQIPDAYHGAKESMFAVKDYVVPGYRPRPGSKVMLRRENESRTLPTFFVDAQIAGKFAQEAVSSARANLEAALDVDSLIEHYTVQQDLVELGDELEPPAYASDPEIAAIQRSYWDVLSGRRETLLRPGATQEMFEARMDTIGELGADDDLETVLGNLAYHGSAQEKIRAHAADVPFELIGTWEAELHDVDGEWVERRFDPTRVAKYMTSATGQWSNLDNLAAALRRCEVSPDELLGQGFQVTRFKDRLVRFDPSTGVPMDTHPSEFMQRLGAQLRQSLEHNAAIPGQILIDEQGVISWTAQKMKRDGSTVEVAGQIGQVFDVGDHGEVITRFASGENALIVPGYEARIIAQAVGENKSVEERTRLRGYEQLMFEQVRYQVAGDLMSGRSQVGEPASLNGVYSRLYGTKHPVDFLERSAVEQLAAADGTERLLAAIQGEQLAEPWNATIVRTEAARVRYSNEVKQGSTIYAEYQAERDRTDPADDNHFSTWALTQRNMAVLTGKDANGKDIPAGYFDPVMTGGATNQGIVRYLTEDARVAPDGSIVPGDPETVTGARAALMSRPELETLRYDPFDRQQMTASTIMQSSQVTELTGTALMTFGGWTADDPIVVSKEFAAAHQIRGAGGVPRDLVVGDKLSDLHGNKGVISLVIDREMSPEDARDLDLEEEVAWFQTNPDMHVVMSPFSLISRRNAGSARELMGGQVVDLYAPGDPAESPSAERRISGGLSQMRFVVTHMAVDEKTKIYDEEQLRAGKGRKASSQLAWALQSQDCPAIMREFYGHNAGAEANLREYLASTGLDMEADGTLRVIGLDQALDERPERRLFEMPPLQVQARKSAGTPALNTPAMRRSFGELIGDRGGDLELPFALNYPTGQELEKATDLTWKMPVLSSHLRSSQEFDDGTSVTHDYTRYYQDVHVEACRYRFAQERLEGRPGQEPPTLSDRERTKILADMSEAQQRAQRGFDAVNGDIQRRVLSGKSNIFKTGLMSSRLPDSATMVWTGDPRLDVDQIALSSVKAQQLGLVEGDHALVWRDPVLRDAGVRYMRVAIDDRLTGAAINPVMDQCFDGDFDGDAVGIAKLHTQAAKDEAIAKLSVPANLLDTGAVKGDGSHPLAMQVSLDTQVAVSKDEFLSEGIEKLGAEANEIHRERRRLTQRIENGEFDDVPPFVSDREAELAQLAEVKAEAQQGLQERSQDLTRRLSDFYRYAQRDEFGSALTFSDREAHLQSVREVCVETGAKGSERKLADYARNLGDEQGTPGITQEDQEASMFATAIKAHGTGLGGSFSQRAVRALRGEDLKAVLEVTYPVTQSILQAKHDAAEARHKYAMLQGPGRELWRGRKLEDHGGGDWRVLREDGNPVQCSAQEWQEQFTAFYTSPVGFGVDVNSDYVARVAGVLEDPRTGLIRNLEEDPSLAGALMDRMAYNGTFEVLVKAAQNRESIYGSDRTAQFASAATRKAIAINHDAMAAYEADVPLAEILEGPKVAAAVLKPDVLAQDEQGAQVRGSARRSEHVTTVHRPVRRTYATYDPSALLDEQVDENEISYGMEV